MPVARTRGCCVCVVLVSSESIRPRPPKRPDASPGVRPPERKGGRHAAGVKRSTRLLGEGFSVIASLLALPAACAPHDGGIGLRLVDGSLVSAMAGQQGSLLVLVYDPSDCLACSGPLAAWLTERPNGPEVKLLFTRRPTPDEARALLVHHLSASGVLQWPRSLATPRAYLYHGACIADSAIGAAKMQRLITRTRTELDSAHQRGAERAPIDP